MIAITESSIDIEALLAEISTPDAGAVVLFLGTTRRTTDGRQTESLDYECYEEMAVRKLTSLESEARQRWPLLNCGIIHRIGNLDIGQASVAIAVSTAHRQAAFEAGKWLIDTLKEVVPIWKKENWADGSSEWVHPTVENIKPEN
ncbi:MAG: molybdenum cofactor biosynthesis protein MoaE [Planctomycetota bacterium]|nr:molybdenum cofactor biosynthesis protein MoaE [Planctomycetota bacterium]